MIPTDEKLVAAGEAKARLQKEKKAPAPEQKLVRSKLTITVEANPRAELRGFSLEEPKRRVVVFTLIRSKRGEHFESVATAGAEAMDSSGLTKSEVIALALI